MNPSAKKSKLGAGGPAMKKPIARANRGGDAPRNLPKTDGVDATTAAGTTSLMAPITKLAVVGGGLPAMPPFSPNSPEEWMLTAAARAFQKYPERAMSVGLRPAPYPVATDAVQAGAPMAPTHGQSVVSAQRVMQYLLARFNPNRGLTPQRLADYLDQWGLGFLRFFSLSWERMAHTDDQ